MLSLVVARVKPETDDVPNELLRKHREFRLEGIRERCEVGLGEFVEALNISRRRVTLSDEYPVEVPKNACGIRVKSSGQSELSASGL